MQSKTVLTRSINGLSIRFSKSNFDKNDPFSERLVAEYPGSLRSVIKLLGHLEKFFSGFHVLLWVMPGFTSWVMILNFYKA